MSKRLGITLILCGAVAVAGCAGGGYRRGPASPGPGSPGPSNPGNPNATFAAPVAATNGSNTTAIPAVGTPLAGTAFPLTQSAISYSANGVGPNTAANNAGATISIINWNPSGSGSFRLEIPGLGINTIFSSSTFLKGSSYDVGNGFDITSLSLEYTALGLWSVVSSSPTSTTHVGAFITGYQTPASAMPTTGTATYSGTNNVAGFVATMPSNGSGGTLLGDASLTANFGTGAVTGNLTNMRVTDIGGGSSVPWNNVSVNASIVSGTSTFGGSTAATNAPPGKYSVPNGATGNIAGAFYGPNAEELGAVWSLASSPNAAIGVIGAPP